MTQSDFLLRCILLCVHKGGANEGRETHNGGTTANQDGSTTANQYGGTMANQDGGTMANQDGSTTANQGGGARSGFLLGKMVVHGQHFSRAQWWCLGRFSQDEMEGSTLS